MDSQLLTTLRKGERGTIVKIGDRIKGPERRRLLDLGIVPGVQIKHRLDGPSGEPRAFEILDSVIALRKEQTDHIFINHKKD